MSPARILIGRGGALGDLLLTFPAMKAVRRAWPKATIVLAAYPPQSRLALMGGWVDELVSLDSAGTAEWFAPTPALSPEQSGFLSSFDIAISFLHDPDGNVAGHLRQAGIRRIVVRSPLVVSGHAIDHFAGALCEAGLSVGAEEGSQLDVADYCVRDGMRRVGQLGGRVVALHPGSGSPRKNWPLERFAELAGMIAKQGHSRPVFVLGDAESGMDERLAAWCPGTPRWKGLDLLELAGFLSSCRCYVGNDSGVTHLAAAVGVPVLALFGPTRPEMWAPRGEHVRVLDAHTATPQRICRLLVR